MSSFHSIATITAALALEVLQKAASAAVPGATVTMTRPDGITGGTPGARVNLFMYQVTPNAAWRNSDLPTRNSNGVATHRPRVALDLHYMLTFYGDDASLEPQRLLGSVALAMHAQSMLTRDMIRKTIINPSFQFLANSNLADEIELVKLTPLPLSLEELSKLWSVLFQTQYVLSMTYQATVVLIEGEETPRTVLPVLEREIFTVPFRHPTIERIRPDTGVNEPVLATSTLVIEGKQLQGEVTQLRIGGSNPTLPQNVSDTQIIFPLTDLKPANSLRAGVQAVQIVQPMLMGRPRVEPHVGVESNVYPLVIHPAFTFGSTSRTQITIDVAPEAGKKQRVLLLLNSIAAAASEEYSFLAEPRPNFEIIDLTLKSLKTEKVDNNILSKLENIKGKSFVFEQDFLNAVKKELGTDLTSDLENLIMKYAGPDAGTDTLTINIANVKAGDYLVRVQVDGAESILQVDTNKDSPTYQQIIEPKVTLV